MIHVVRAVALAFLCAFTTAVWAQGELPAESVTSPLTTVDAQAGSESPPIDAPQVKEVPGSPAEASAGGDQQTESPLVNLHTIWDFEIDVTAFQHEPAGKSLDKFVSKLKFGAVLPHGAKTAMPWTGYGEMSADELGRAPQSFQV